MSGRDRRHPVRCAAVGLLMLLGAEVRAAEPAVTEDRAAAKLSFEEGEGHYRLGQFEQALEAYSRAYRQFPRPAFLFNIGQCHRNLEDWQKAIFFFRGYLNESPGTPDRPQVEALIADLEVRQREREAAALRTTTGTSAPNNLVLAAPAPVAEPEGLSAWWIVGGIVVLAAAGVIAGLALSGGDDGLPSDLAPGARVLDFRDR